MRVGEVKQKIRNMFDHKIILPEFQIDFDLFVVGADKSIVRGEFAIELRHSDSGQVVAVLGFCVYENESGQVGLTVNHTPQGRSDWAGQRQLKDHFMKYSKFRTDMLKGLVEIGREAQVDFVQVIGALNHEKVCRDCTPDELRQGGYISFNRGIQIIDTPAREAGFEQIYGGDLIVRITYS